MTSKDEALKMAIEYFEFEQKVWAGLNKENYYDKPINACKEALEQPAEPRLVSYAPDGSTCTLNIDGEEVYFNREQPAQEPVAYLKEVGGYGIIDFAHFDEDGAYPVYIHPHQSRCKE